MTDEPTPSLWDELLGDSHHRKPAIPKPRLKPGHWDDHEYHDRSEEDFGEEAYIQELREIKRLQALKEKQQHE